jgi:hypothetical protein
MKELDMKDPQTERYTLNPLFKPGSEHEIHMIKDKNGEPVYALTYVPDVGMMILPPAAVTKVESGETSWPEPPHGSVVKNERGVIFQRTRTFPTRHWTTPGATDVYTWAGICSSGEPTLLEAKEKVNVRLPWGNSSQFGTYVTVDSIRTGANPGVVQIIFNGGNDAALSSSVARDMARALNRAADLVDGVA